MDLIPTCLVGCHGDGHWLIWARVILGHSIHCPDFKCVIGMSQQVSDGDFGGLQAVLLRGIVDPTSTGPALAGISSSTPLAHHIVGDVLAATCVLRTAPLQVHRSLVDIWNQIQGSRWRAWGKEKSVPSHQELEWSFYNFWAYVRSI